MPTSPAARRLTSLALVAALVTTLAACGSSGPEPAASAPATTTTPTSAAPVAPTSTKPSAPTTAQLQAKARTQLAALMRKAPRGGVSVAAYDVNTGATHTAGRTSGMWTASVYKLFILEALLVQNPGGLSGGERSAAIPAIEQSNNAAGYQLFLAAGSNPGLRSAWKRLGLHHTTPGASDPTFTETSAMQCLTLLKNLVEKKSPLSADQRAYTLNLMRQVESDQRWGVGAAADKNTRFANKNGWLSIDGNNPPGERDGGLWAVNSVGVVTVKGHTLLLAVMTEHNPDFDGGVAYVQQLAKALAATVRP